MIDPEKERQRLAQAYAEMSEVELEKLADAAWSLTEPAREALKTELSRRNLGITLNDSAPKKEDPAKIVILRRYTSLHEALVAKCALESAGIECFLRDENMIRMDWFWSNALGGVKLCVREEDAETAATLLEQDGPETFQVEGTGEYERPHCQRCQSMDISFEGLVKPVAYGSLAGLWFAGIVPPIPLKHHGWKCHSCGHEWDGTADPPEQAP